MSSPSSGSRSLKHAASSESLNSHPLLNQSASSGTEQTAPASSPTDSSRLAPPPPPQHLQQTPTDYSRPIHSRNTSSSSLEASGGSSVTGGGRGGGSTTPSSGPAYDKLRYAPRQRAAPVPFKASQPVFQSHGSAFSHAQPATLSSSPSSGTVSPSSAARTSSPSRPALSSDNTNNATLSPPNVNPAGEYVSHTTALARAQLNKLKSDAQQLKLLPRSFGWTLVERLQAATEGEWAALAELVSTGEATLLLPQSEISQPSELSLSDAYDHILLSCSPSRPSPTSAVAAPSSSFSGAKASGVVTLSGLRGTIEDVAEADLPGGTKRTGKLVEREGEAGKEDSASEEERALSLVFSSFIPRSDSNFISELRHSKSRVALLSSLAALPRPSADSTQEVMKSGLFGSTSNPEVRLGAYSAELALPLPPWSSHGSQARRRSGSASARVANRASASFSSLFGGSGRDRKGSQSSLPTVNSLDNNPGNHSDSSGEALAGAQSSIDPSATQEIAATSSLDNGKDGSASTEAAAQRTISVWVVNKSISKSRVLTELSAAVDSRIRFELSQASIPSSAIDSISNFSRTFFPLVDSQPSSRSKLTPRAPWQLSPDELSESFQDVLAGVRSQLENAETKENEESKGSEEEIDRKVEVIERTLCIEIYDRLFCPLNSRDAALDDSLASRIAALNVLGLSLQHLGLVIPDKDDASLTAEAKEEARLVSGGLSDMIALCGKELQKLQTPACRSPQDKLSILVTTHKLVVDGLAQLPPVELKKEGDDDPRPPTTTDSKTEQSDAATASQTDPSFVTEASSDESKLKPEMVQARAPTTSSADLILPILIFAIVSSNPPSLASNLLYIQRFRTESLVRGEASYCLVNMQAAVAFLENVDPPALGLQGAGQILGFGSEFEARGHRAKAPSSEIKAANTLSSTSEGSFSMPLRIRGRLTQEIGELAGASNGVIRGVLGSSFSAFGRMMGASASVGAETWDQARADGPKTLEDIKSILSGGARLAASPLIRSGSLGTGLGLRDTSAAGMSGAKEMSDIMTSKSGSEKARPEPRTTWSNSSIRNKPAATDYGAEEEIFKDQSLPDSTSSKEKLSISDRLASISMLSRFGNTGERSPNLGTAPLPREKEIPGPPPPFKSSRGSHPPPLRSNSDQTKAPSPNMHSRGLASPLGSPMGMSPHIPTSLQSPYPPLSSPPTSSRPLHVVLASSGSVASIKIPLIVEELLQYKNVRVQIISTSSSLHFFDRNIMKELDQRDAALEDPNPTAKSDSSTETSSYKVSDLASENLAASRGTKPSATRLPRAHLWSDEDEWNNWSKVGDTILHIELRRWADIVLVAPCSANTLAKITNGICDSLLTSFLRALSPSTPTFLFPAMNTLMYLHPLTSRQISIARDLLGYSVVGPIEKRLACGDQGQGAMTEWIDIVNLVVERFHLEPLQGVA